MNSSLLQILVLNCVAKCVSLTHLGLIVGFCDCQGWLYFLGLVFCCVWTGLELCLRCKWWLSLQGSGEMKLILVSGICRAAVKEARELWWRETPGIGNRLPFLYSEVWRDCQGFCILFCGSNISHFKIKFSLLWIYPLVLWLVQYATTIIRNRTSLRLLLM